MNNNEPGLFRDPATAYDQVLYHLAAILEKESLVWTYFTKLTLKEARCDECGSKIATARNTSNLMKVYKSDSHHAMLYI